MEVLDVVFLMFSMLLMTVVFVFLIRHSNRVLLSKIYDLESRHESLHKIVKHTSKNSSSSGVHVTKRLEALEKKFAEHSMNASPKSSTKAVEAKA